MDKFWFLLLLCLIPFAFFLAKPTIWGTDSFYFLSVSCDLAEPTGIPILAEQFFLGMPCDQLAFKILFFAVLFISTLLLSKFGELFSKEYGWLAGPSAFLSTFWVLSFSQIEDDILAYPILFTAMWLFLKGKKEGKPLYQYMALGTAIITGGLLWQGALLYLIAFSFSFIPALVATIIIVFFVLKSVGTLIGSLYTNFDVQENLPIIGLFYQYVLLAGFIGVNRVLFLEILFFAFIVFLNGKFAIHLTFLLALAMVVLTKKLMALKYPKGVLAILQRNWLTILPIYALLFSFVGGYLIYVAPPYENQIQAVEYAIEQADGEMICNDWSYGYYIMALGGTPNAFGGDATDDFTHDCFERIALSENDIDCKVLKNFGKSFRESLELKVYEC